MPPPMPLPPLLVSFVGELGIRGVVSKVLLVVVLLSAVLVTNAALLGELGCDCSPLMSAAMGPPPWKLLNRCGEATIL